MKVVIQEKLLEIKKTQNGILQKCTIYLAILTQEYHTKTYSCKITRL